MLSVLSSREYFGLKAILAACTGDSMTEVLAMSIKISSKFSSSSIFFTGEAYLLWLYMGISNLSYSLTFANPSEIVTFSLGLTFDDWLINFLFSSLRKSLSLFAFDGLTGSSFLVHLTMAVQTLGGRGQTCEIVLLGNLGGIIQDLIAPFFSKKLLRSLKFMGLG